MRGLYWLFAHLGLMVVTASFIFGFRHDPNAPAVHYLYNALIYGAYIAVHFVMTRPWFKRALTGSAEGSLLERRIYVSIAILTWLVVYAVHYPLPGPALDPPAWLRYAGLCGALLGLFAFLEGSTFTQTSGLLGVPGATLDRSHGGETPLLMEGSYASVRHPMYRGFVALAAASLLIHANAAQLFWVVVVGASFVLFIPVEERDLLAARGDEYRAYMQVTRYRLIRGIW